MQNSLFSQLERRKYPRIHKKFPLRVKIKSFDICAEAQNISLSGVYCQADKDIELMAKVSILLLLPLKRNNSNNKTITKRINCKGVVVRVEKARECEGKYNIAVFFNDMKKTDESVIRQYVESHLQLSPVVF